MRCGLAVAVACLALTLCGAAQAQDQDQDQDAPEGFEAARQVHWALGAFFGTGWYQVDENRSVFILRLSPRQTLQESSLGPDGTRRFGVEILYPVSIGLTRIDDVPDFIDLDNYATVSFTPGIQVEVPVNERWSLRPYLHLGYGKESRSGEGAWIGYGGLKSRYVLGEGYFRWTVLNSLNVAGYGPEYEDRGRYASLMAGLEFSQPLRPAGNGKDALYLNWRLDYDWYFDRLKFHVDEDRVESLRDQWELGIAVSKRDKPITIGFLSFEQIGLAYRWSSDATFNAITLNFRSPFTE